MSPVRESFFNIFAATLHIGGHNVRTRHVVMTGDTKLILYAAMALKDRLICEVPLCPVLYCHFITQRTVFRNTLCVVKNVGVVGCEAVLLSTNF